MENLNFINKFENDLQDLDNMETPYDHIMYMISFLNNIEDKVCKIINKALSMKYSKNYANCLPEISRK